MAWESFNRRSLLKAGLALPAAALMPRALTAAVAQEDDVLTAARTALEMHRHRLPYTDVVGIADFRQHYTRPRFHLLDMASGARESFLVTHGEGSDPDATGWLQSFSNRPGSRATSAGAYLTREGYEGQYGSARRLTGLDPENNNAYERAIVIHGIDYVSTELASRGVIGLSWGCFAFSYDDIATILDRLGPGRLLYAFKD